MLGAIFGDIVGSHYEFDPTKNYDFQLLHEDSRPTDDTVMTLAVAKALMDTYGKDDDTIRRAVVREMQRLGRKYHNAGYGGRFCHWLDEHEPKPYNSYGNGSGMRVSAVGWLYPSLGQTLNMAKLTADVTHNHPEGIKGAQAIAAGMYLARTGHDKDFIKEYIANTFRYDLDRTLDDIRPTYEFDVTCQGSVPEAIIAFLESDSYEDAMQTPRPVWPAPSRKPSMAMYRSRSKKKPWNAYPKTLERSPNASRSSGRTPAKPAASTGSTVAMNSSTPFHRNTINPGKMI